MKKILFTFDSMRTVLFIKFPIECAKVYDLIARKFARCILSLCPYEYKKKKKKLPGDFLRCVCLIVKVNPRIA